MDLCEALSAPTPCACDCHAVLSLEERTQGIAALYRFDDAMRGWGYDVQYEPHAHVSFRAAQARNDESWRGIPVRDDACLYSRLLGFAVHELIHALNGDPGKANHGIPFGLPYGVPLELPVGEERAYLAPFNDAEARAFVGVARVARELFGIEWTLRCARDVGTYGFVGGNALVEVPPGFRAVPHVDRQLQPQRYYAMARRLEERASEWLTPERLAELRARFEVAEAAGRALRRKSFPSAASLASLPVRRPGRNDLCGCGSARKWKKCCGSLSSTGS